ncbi:MAG: NAD(P)-binding protein [Oscillospiraceae bacterium]|nr:NAD(P)-binding protein [Oscillospiraceae bacterium]
MSRLTIRSASRAQTTIEGIYTDMERRIIASPPGLCPVDLTAAFLKMCQAQTCGKCVPCRVGMSQLANMLEEIQAHRATMETLEKLRSTAVVIENSADCAIGIEAARMVQRSIEGCYDDYVSHIQNHRCTSTISQSIPCVANCPAGVDIPGYVALVEVGRYADAVRLIRKDNPLPVACAMICEHPCESRCRRTLLDAPINIRGLKLAAVDHAGVVPAPQCAESTGKRVAIIGGGPSGLSAAYYLQLMGHQCTIFEKRKHLGGMLRYGIPSYRLPRQRLQEDIDCILSTGVEVRLETGIGRGEGMISMEQLRSDYDAVFISIGAHDDKKVGIPNEDAEGVLSAVEMMGSIGDGIMPDFTGKRVCVIGGGNVAMDCTRSAIRCGAEKVSIVYRRRQVDMTAQAEEIQGALEEGAEMLDLHAPLSVEVDSQGRVIGLWTEPKQVGLIRDRRAEVISRGREPEMIPCDVIVVAIGQSIETQYFEEEGIPIKRGVIEAQDWTAVGDADGVFAGGDCVTGPKTAIRAIAAGKVAAANIDNYLGYYHHITVDVDIPEVSLRDHKYCGRINLSERSAADRKDNFLPMEQGMNELDAKQEASRCLRCDHFGCGIFKGGRRNEW